MTRRRCPGEEGVLTSGPDEDAAPGQPWPELDAGAISVFGETVTYRELLFVGAASGLLGVVLSNASLGHALENEFPDSVSAAEMSSKALEMRRARRLESGEAFRAWLDARRLGAEDFRAYLRRLVARSNEVLVARAGKRPAAHDAARIGATPALTPRVAFAELAFSGAWGDFADEAARLVAGEHVELSSPASSSPGAAAARTIEEGPRGEAADRSGISETLSWLAPSPAGWWTERLAEHGRRLRARNELRRLIASSGKVHDRVSSHHLDWTVLDLEELPLPSAGAASEALALARIDGEPAEAIATRAGGALLRRRCRRGELGAEVAVLIDQAGEGEATGPLLTAAGASVFFLLQRRAPDPADQLVAEMAVEELLSEALDDAKAGAIVELEEL